jgi:hypothetical protein
MAARINPVDGEPEPRVTIAAFDRAMFDDEAERALFAIDGVPDLDDEDGDERPESYVTAAELAAAQARADAMTDAEVIEAAAAAVPLPDFELTDLQCMDVAALLGPYVGEEP